MSTRRRGQALVEITLSFVVIIPFFFGALSVWRAYYESWAYEGAAQALTSWISHDGGWSTTMHDSLDAELAQLPMINPSGAYLSFRVGSPSAPGQASNGVSVVPCGPQSAAEAEAYAPPAVPQDCWTQINAELGNGIPSGSELWVMVYGYSQFTVPMTPIDRYLTSSGTSAVMIVSDKAGQ